MDHQKLLTTLQHNFAFTNHIPDILGVLLFGSYLTGEETKRSDVDICIVSRHLPTLGLWNRIIDGQTAPNDVYSIHFFHELPLYIQKDVFQRGIVIVSRDIPTLYEFFYPYQKRWEDNRYVIEQAQ